MAATQTQMRVLSTEVQCLRYNLVMLANARFAGNGSSSSSPQKGPKTTGKSEEETPTGFDNNEDC